MTRKTNKKKKTTANSKKQSTPSLWAWILPLCLLALCLIIVLKTGIIGQLLTNVSRLLFGQFYIILIVICALLCLIALLVKQKGMGSFTSILALMILLICFTLLQCFALKEDVIGMDVLDYIIDNLQPMYQGNVHAYGGLIGLFLYGILSMLMGRLGTMIVISTLVVIAIVLLCTNNYWKLIFEKVKSIITLPSQLISFESDDSDEEYLPEVKTHQADTNEVIEERPVKYLASDPINTEPKGLFIDANEKPIENQSYLENDHDNDLDNLDILTAKDSISNPIDENPQTKKSIFIDADHPIELNEINQDKQYQPSHTQEETINHIDTHAYTKDSSDDEVIPVDHNDDVSLPDSSSEQVQEEPVQHAPSISATIARLASQKRNEANDRIKPPSSGPYRIVPQTLLDPISANKKSEANMIAAKEKGKRLVEVLQTFGINTTLVATHIGPAVTKFEVKPEASVKVSKISNLADNIKMELQSRQLRIEAPIPGHNAVGVEIPNVESTMVRMKEVINSQVMKADNSPMLFALGKNLFGEAVACRLDKMPHLLIAGATGSGKSVCMNTIITSFLLRTHPDDLKLLLIDPKKVEFTPYHEIPHLIGPVINDPNQANNALKAIVKEMDDRYNLFSLCGVRKLDDYNQLAKNDPDLTPLPYIVVIIDELADLMVVAGKEVEASIQRITQLARAAGIHLIIATQRPSTDVITGVIKANIPSRIAFAVSSSIDSRTILDKAGAERLLGYGDMLYVPMGEQTPIRVQGVYVSDQEVSNICDYAKRQRSPRYADAFVRLEGVEGNESSAVGTIEADPLFMECRQYVIQTQKASTSLLQRRFQIGYNRAARIIEALEENGVIGPAKGSKPREVYIQDEQIQ